MNSLRRNRYLFFTLLTILLLAAFPVIAFGATHYVDGSAANDSGDGTQAFPKKYIQSGLDLLNESGGDTLIIANGTYSDTKDKITYSHFPSGTSYTTVRAETDWGVTINFPFTLGDDRNNTNYVIIQGIRFVSPGGDTGGSAYVGHHAKILRCAFINSMAVDYGALLTIGSRTRAKTVDSEYILVEDCYGYGLGGRYKFYTQSVKKVIFRRLVVRADGGWSATASLPSAGLMVYNSEDILLQNCIVIDSELDIDNWKGAYYTAAKSGSSWPILLGKVTWSGCMAVKVRSIGYHMDLNSICYDLDLENNIVLGADSTGYGFFVNQHDGHNTIDYMTVLNADRGIRENFSDFHVAITNSIASDNDRENFSGLSNFTVDHSVSWNGGSGDDLVHPATNSYTYDPKLNGLMYPVRVEPGSNLAEAGSGGNRIGAEIIKKIGVSGTVWDDPGYNDTTDEDLWPFPYEDQIRSDMRTQPTIGTRGFCADGQTLTNYIWGYLGNTVPPFNPRIQSVMSGTEATLTWDANTEPDFDHYNLYVGTASGTYDFAGYASADKHDVGNTTSHTVSDLTPGTSYYFAVTAVDTDGNESGIYREVSRQEITITPVSSTNTSPITISGTRESDETVTVTVSPTTGATVTNYFEPAATTWRADITFSTEGTYTIKAALAGGSAAYEKIDYDTAAPQLTSPPTETSVTETSAIIEFDTDEPGTGIVYYGTVTGTWSNVEYNSGQTTLTANGTPVWLDDRFAGKKLNPDLTQRSIFSIVSNTDADDTIVVSGDVSDIAHVGDAFAVYEYKKTTAEITQEVSTGLSSNVLQDANNFWLTDEFAGLEINPDVSQNHTFKILSNTPTAITTDPDYGDMTRVVSTKESGNSTAYEDQTLTDAAKTNWTVDEFAGMFLVPKNTGSVEDKVFLITSNTDTGEISTDIADGNISDVPGIEVGDQYKIIPGGDASTALDPNKLTDDTKSWTADEFQGMLLVPKYTGSADDSTFMIISNTGTEIFTDLLDGNIATVSGAVVGDRYLIVPKYEIYQTSHSIELKNLSGSTTYFYQVASADGASNNDATASDDNNPSLAKSVTAQAGGDGTPPVIFGTPTVTATDTTATIEWTTDEPADGRVNFRVSSAAQSLVSKLAKTSLKEATSPPWWSDMDPSQMAIVPNEANKDVRFLIVGWNTGTGLIDTDPAYDLTATDTNNGDSYRLVKISAGFEQSHSITLTGLKPGTSYTFYVHSKDASDNFSTSNDVTFSTADFADTAAPQIISPPSVAAISNTTAVIEWMTDEPADSVVEYGLTSAYGASQPLTSFVSNHVVTLTGLADGTTYHYRVGSTDVTGNGPAYSIDFTFTTKSGADVDAPQIISPPTVTFLSDTAALIEWITNEPGTSAVKFGINDDDITGNSDAAGLTANTLTHTGAFGADNSLVGRELNPDVTQNSTFTIIANTADQITTDPTDGDMTTVAAAEDPYSVRYGQTNSSGAIVTNHAVTLTGLDPSKFYHFQVNSTDTSGNGMNTNLTDNNPSADNTFITKSAADNTAPQLFPPSVTALSDTTAVIEWTTNEPGSSLVQYGKNADDITGISEGLTANTLTHTGAFGDVNSLVGKELNPDISQNSTFTIIANTADQITTDAGDGDMTTIVTNIAGGDPYSVRYGQTRSSGAMVTAHVVTLTGLDPSTFYHFQVSSTDPAGNGMNTDLTDKNPSVDNTLTTKAAADTTAPQNTPPTVTVTDTTAVIEWDTNEPANSVVYYGETYQVWGSYDSVKSDASMVTHHSVPLTGLQDSTTYHFRVGSTDAAFNGPNLNPNASNPSVDDTFTTTAPGDNKAPQITSVPPFATDLGYTTAVIEWITNEQGNSTVKYGKSTDEISGASDAAGLTANTLTHTGAFTADALVGRELNPNTTQNSTFTIIANTADQITTDPADGDMTTVAAAEDPYAVRYGLTVTNGNMVTAHTVTLTGLDSATSYQFQVSSTDAFGNGVNTDLTDDNPSVSDTFTTEAAADETAPQISLPTVAVTTLGDTTATIEWTTDEVSNSTVKYGKSVDEISGVSEGLTANTLTHTGAFTADALVGKELNPDTAQNSTFTIIANTADQITTDPADGDMTTVAAAEDPYAVRYGLIINNGNMATGHAVTLTNLDPATSYQFQVSATDSAGNGANANLADNNPSPGSTFTTEATPDTTAPQIIPSSLTVTANTTLAVIEWDTDEPGTSIVHYGLTSEDWGSYDTVKSDSSLVTHHSVTLTPLTDDTHYYFRIGSTDAAFNGPALNSSASNPSEENEFSTPATPDTVAPQILVPPTATAPAATSISDTTAVIKWTTDEASNSFVKYGKDSDDITGSNSEGLTANTLTHTGAFTAGALVGRELNPYTDQNSTFTIIANTADQITTDPADGDMTVVAASGNEYSVRYGLIKSSGTMVKTHVVTLTGLDSDIDYHFQVSSADAFGNNTATDLADANPSMDYTFHTLEDADIYAPVVDLVSTPSLTADVTGSSTGLAANTLTDTGASWTTNELAGKELNPDISQGSTFTIVSNTATVITTDAADGDMTTVAAVTDSYLIETDLWYDRAEIRWTTDEPGSSVVKYGKTGNDFTGNSTGLTANTLTNTSANWTANALVGKELNPDTTQDSTFTIISNTATAITTDAADGNMTDVAAATNPYAVRYGQTKSSSTLVTDHVVVLTGLDPETGYHFQVSSTDAFGNGTAADLADDDPGADKTFTTDTPPDTTSPWIIEYPDANFPLVDHANNTIDITYSEPYMQGAAVEGNYSFSTSNSTDDIVKTASSTYRLFMDSIPDYTIITMNVTNVTDAYNNPLAPSSITLNDDDKDGMADDWELHYGLDPTNAADADLDSESPGDGMPNLFEFTYGLNPEVDDADLDLDGDGWTNYEEYINSTEPNNINSKPATSSPQIVEVIPHDNAGITDSARIPNNSSFYVRVKDDEGINIDDSDTNFNETDIRFTVDDGDNSAFTLDLSDDAIRPVKLTNESDSTVTDLWIAYDREEDYRGNYLYDTEINIKVDVTNKRGNSMAQASYDFRIETEAEHNDAQDPDNLPDFGVVDPADPALVGLYDSGIQVNSGGLTGAKIIYDSNETVPPTFGPTNEIPAFNIGGFTVIGLPLNLQPPTVFTTPAIIFIPVPDVEDVSEYSIYLYNGSDWVLACDADGNIQTEGEGWMVPGSRVNHNNGDPSTIEIQVYHFSGVQAGIATPASDQTPSAEGGGGGCFIATAAFGSKFEKHVRILRQFRDVFLLPTKAGQAFVKAYYKYSPAAADFIAGYDALRTMVRWSLLPIVGLTWMALHLGAAPTLLLLLGLVMAFMFIRHRFVLTANKRR